MMIELKTFYGSAWLTPVFVSSIDFQDTAAFVRCDGTDYKVTHEEANTLLAKINGKSETPTAQPSKVQVRAIKSIERTSTWSNSTQKHFDFWRCILDNDEKVNVFDHPDESRNTFKIVKTQGWESIFADTDEGIEYEPKAPIPCTVSFDGQWYSLVNIQVFGHYLQAHDISNENDVIQVDFDPDNYQDYSDDDFEPDGEVDPYRAPFIDFDDDDESEADNA